MSERSIISSWQAYQTELQSALATIREEEIDAAVDMILHAWQAEATVYVIGNGGSASTASHISCDWSKGASAEGVRHLRVVSLTDNMAFFSAIGNDIGYDAVFSRQLMNLLQPGDVVVGISASGNSPNTVKAFEYAKSQGAKIIAMLGFTGGKMAQLADVVLLANSHAYGPVEDAHMILNHVMTEKLRAALAAHK